MHSGPVHLPFIPSASSYRTPESSPFYILVASLMHGLAFVPKMIARCYMIGPGHSPADSQLCHSYFNQPGALLIYVCLVSPHSQPLSSILVSPVRGHLRWIAELKMALLSFSFSLVLALAWSGFGHSWIS